MSDEQAPDVPADSSATTDAEAPPEPTREPRRLRSRRGSTSSGAVPADAAPAAEGDVAPAVEGDAAPAVEDDALPAAEAQLPEETDNEPDAAADGAEHVGDLGAPAGGHAGDEGSGELRYPELFDPAETANAPRAPHPLKPVVEALIFASPEPLTVKAMTRLLEEHGKEEIEAALVEVRETYLRSDGLQLVEVAGGYQIVTRPELYEWVRRLFKERTTSKLSVQALETLAVIAYKQPVTSGEIAEIRGVSATTGVLNTLLDRKLVKIVGRKQVVGRPFMYGTTREFLDKFGLRDLSDLPKVEDMSEALGFDLPSPVDEGDGVSLPFEAPVALGLFGDSDAAGAAPPAGGSHVSGVAAAASDDGELASHGAPAQPDAPQALDAAPLATEPPATPDDER